MKLTKFKNKNAITLIGLIVTIIVLVILTGISLSLVFGENGITGRAVNAGKTQNIAGAKEKFELEVANLGSEFYQAKYMNGSVLPDALDAYILANLPSNVDDYSVTKSGSSVTLKATTGSDRTSATATIDENGNVIWDGIDYGNGSGGGGSLTIPSDLQIGSTITWTPSGSYVWDKDLYASTESSSYPNVYLASGDKATTESINSRKAELMAKTNKTAEETKELDALNNPMTMTISNWRVLSKTDNEVEIVPDEPTGQEPKLEGAQGYNNAVKLLNDACSSLYGSGNGITARSIKIEDIENAVKEVGNESILTTKQGANYNNYPYSEYSSYKSYPAIWAEELGAEIDRTPQNKTLGLSSQSSFFTNRDQKSSNNIVGGATAETSIRVKQTYYSSTLSDLFKVNDSDSDEIKNKKAKYLDIFNTSDDYWVASRCVYTYSSCCVFIVRDVGSGSLSGSIYLFGSGGGEYDDSSPLFPVVSLSSDLIKKDGSGNYYVDIQ